MNRPARWLDVALALATPEGRAVLADLVAPPDLLGGCERVVDLGAARAFIEDQQAARRRQEAECESLRAEAARAWAQAGASSEALLVLRAAYDRLLVRLREDERLGDQIAGRLKRAEVERDEARAELAELRAATKGKP